jgi:polysaccharide export outer membrane protein
MAALFVLAQAGQADEASKSVNFAQPKGISAPPAEPAPETAGESVPQQAAASQEYKIGNDDIIDIAVLQPEQLALTVTVSPDGSITFPYIGKVDVKGKTPSEVQEEIQTRLSDGYLKYPVVSVAGK